MSVGKTVIFSTNWDIVADFSGVYELASGICGNCKETRVVFRNGLLKGKVDPEVVAEVKKIAAKDGNEKALIAYLENALIYKDRASEGSWAS